ncbi:hypothetical protein HDU96_002658 [Phlyctochytrium bullatum]|nr:hypothetical protein HDU96_002658 [Phlyctochytrium bullatum]
MTGEVFGLSEAKKSRTEQATDAVVAPSSKHPINKLHDEVITIMEDSTKAAGLETGKEVEEVHVPPENAEELKVEAANHVAEGKRCFALANYEGAVEEFGAASQLLASIYGPNATECADVLYSYGLALFNNAVSKSSPLGGSVVADAATEAVAESLKSHITIPASQKDTSRFVFSGDGPEVEEQGSSSNGASISAAVEHANAEAAGNEAGNEEDGGSDDEEEDPVDEDMQIAWESLDLARVIFLKMGESKRRKVADVLLALGDVSLELGQWSSAIEDFSEAVRIKEVLLTDTDRELAEAHYKLALALEFSGDLVKALEHTKVVVAVLERRLSHLRESRTGDSSVSKQDVESEISDLEGLMPEVTGKLDELVTELSKKASGSGSTASNVASEAKLSSASASKSTAEARDVSNLVRKKGAPRPDDTDSSKSAGKRKDDDENIPDVKGKRPKYAETENMSTEP